MKRVLFTVLIFLTCILYAHDEQEKTTEEITKKEIPTITEKISVIELTTADTVIYRNVNIAPTEVLVLEFPEGIQLSGDVSQALAIGHDSIIKADVIPSPLIIKVTALQYQVGLNTNLQIKTNAGITMIFNFKTEDPKKSSNRIIFTFPEYTNQMKKDRDSFLQLKLKLQEEYNEKVKQLDTEAEKLRIKGNTKGFSEFYMCNDYVNREQQDLVFFTSTRICKWGGKKDKGGDVYINFYIKNRFKNFFYIKDVKVYGLQGDSRIPIESRELFLEKYGIQFDEVLNGAVGFKLDDYYRQYVIELHEEAGKKRIISVTVGF